MTRLAIVLGCALLSAIPSPSADAWPLASLLAHADAARGADCSAACPPTGTVQVRSHAYFPMEIGDSWVYVSSVRGEVSNTVMEVVRDEEYTWYRMEHSDERGTTQQIFVRFDGDQVFQRIGAAPEFLLVDFGVPVGGTFSSTRGGTETVVTFVAYHAAVDVLGHDFRDVRQYRHQAQGGVYDVYFARGLGIVGTEGVSFGLQSRLVQARVGGTEFVADEVTSAVATRAFEPYQIENLALLAQVWGFTKYHHPAVAGGHLDWDAALLSILPAVLDAGGRAAAVAALNRWLDDVGEPPPCRPCAALGGDLHLAPDIDWIHDTAALGEELSGRLVRMHRNRPASGAQHYVSFADGRLDFRVEAPHAMGPVPDTGYRLLALFRYWNVIRYWFPYRDLLDDDWDAILHEFIPEFMAADDVASYRLGVLRLVGRIQDTHAILHAASGLRPPVGPAQLPVRTRFVEGGAVITGYTHPELGPASGLEVGDVVLRIDGAPVDSLVAAWRPYYPASNETVRLHQMAQMLTRGPAGSTRLTVGREGAVSEITAQRVPVAQLDRHGSPVHDLPGDTFQMLSDDVAYLKLSSVARVDVPDYFRRAAGARVLVVDIRNYPAEFVTHQLVGHLVDRPTPFAMFTVGDPRNPGAFQWTGPAVAVPQSPRYTGSVVVLTDEASISQSEFTAMALRAGPNTLVVGSTTAGADGDVAYIPLPGGLVTRISGIGVFYPDRSPKQRIGIVPDLYVRPTIAGIRAGRDEVLEAGVSLALGRDWQLAP